MITVDGLDATEKLCSMLNGWLFDAIMLAGVSFAGFNLVDPTMLYEKFEKPILIISRVKPNNIAVKNALIRHFKDWEIRWKIFEKLGPVYEVVSLPREPPIYLEIIGTNLEFAVTLIKATSIFCRVPEPLRVARLIARGLTRRRSL